MSLCVAGASFCHCFSSTASAISGTLFLRRVLTAVQFGDMRPGMVSCSRLAASVMGLIWGALLAMRPNDRELVPPSAGLSVLGREKKLLPCAHKTRAGAQKARRFRFLLSRRSFAVLAWMCTCN